MQGLKADIIARLQKEILPLQGFKHRVRKIPVDFGLGPIQHAFPGKIFPLGAIHEFITTRPEENAASMGFITALLSGVMKNNGACLWAGTNRLLFPPALPLLGVSPQQIIFIELQSARQVSWVIEEALKCNSLAAVIGEMRELDFTTSRRLQLAVEQSQVTGFILRTDPGKLQTNACLARWKIQPLPCSAHGDMPGISFPRWNIEILKMRNGKTGQWPLEWRAGKFYHADTGIGTTTRNIPVIKTA